MRVYHWSILRFVPKGDLPAGNITIAIAFGHIVIDGERAHHAKMQISYDGNGIFRPCVQIRD
jgi:hypothetical protein